MSGCGWTDGTSHRDMAIESGAGCFRKKMISGFGHSKLQVPAEHV